MSDLESLLSQHSQKIQPPDGELNQQIKGQYPHEITTYPVVIYYLFPKITERAIKAIRSQA